MPKIYSDALTYEEEELLSNFWSENAFDIKNFTDSHFKIIAKWIQETKKRQEYELIARLPNAIHERLTHYLPLDKQPDLQIIKRIAAIKNLGIRFGIQGQFDLENIHFQGATSTSLNAWYSLQDSMQAFYDDSQEAKDPILSTTLRHFFKLPFSQDFINQPIHARTIETEAENELEQHCIAWGICGNYLLVADRNHPINGINIFYLSPGSLYTFAQQTPGSIYDARSFDIFVKNHTPVYHIPKYQQMGINCSMIANRHVLFLLLFSYAYQHNSSQGLASASDYAIRTSKRLNHFDRQYTLQRYLSQLSVPGPAERLVLAHIMLKCRRHPLARDLYPHIQAIGLVQESDLQTARLQLLRRNYETLFADGFKEDEILQTMGPILQAYFDGISKDKLKEYEKNAATELYKTHSTP